MALSRVGRRAIATNAVDPKVTFMKRGKYDTPQASSYFIRLTRARELTFLESWRAWPFCLSSNPTF